MEPKLLVSVGVFGSSTNELGMRSLTLYSDVINPSTIQRKDFESKLILYDFHCTTILNNEKYHPMPNFVTWLVRMRLVGILCFHKQ